MKLDLTKKEADYVGCKDCNEQGCDKCNWTGYFLIKRK